MGGPEALYSLHAAMTAKKTGPLNPKLKRVDWRHFTAPDQNTALLSNDDRVLPLARVTP